MPRRGRHGGNKTAAMSTPNDADRSGRTELDHGRPSPPFASTDGLVNSACRSQFGCPRRGLVPDRARNGRSRRVTDHCYSRSERQAALHGRHLGQRSRTAAVNTVAARGRRRLALTPGAIAPWSIICRPRSPPTCRTGLDLALDVLVRRRGLRGVAPLRSLE